MGKSDYDSAKEEIPGTKAEKAPDAKPAEAVVVQPANQGGVGKTVGAGTADADAPPPRNAVSDLRSFVSGGTAGPRVGHDVLTRYHPVYGARTAADPNEAATLFQPNHDWWPTPAEADMHRTDREAQQAIHHTRSVKIADKMAKAAGETDPEKSPFNAEENKAVVINSVQADESRKAGTEPVI